MSPAVREFPEFVRVERGRRVALVHPEFVPALADALLDGRGLSPAGLGGRSELLRCQTPRGNALIRPCHRGGLIERLLGDRYVLRNRPREELEVHARAWSAGVPTVMPLGAMWERSGPFVRGSFATLEAGAVDLLRYLQAHPIPDATLLAACGRAILALHRAGFYHADLQVKNLLVNGGEALIIDFDRARATPVSSAMAARNLARLKRSFVKHGLPLTAFDAITGAYYDAG